jgi:hypothetical protein
MTMARFRASKRQRLMSDLRWAITEVIPETITALLLFGAAMLIPMMFMK